MTTDNERLLKLEQTIAHQDQQIEDLSDMVSQQWTEIDRLKKALNRTQGRLDDLENTDDSSAISHEKPPHY